MTWKPTGDGLTDFNWDGIELTVQLYNFDTDGDELKEVRHKAHLRNWPEAPPPIAGGACSGVIELLRSRPNLCVHMAGYASRLGPAKYNQRLSERRVENVRQFLRENGVAESRFRRFGFQGWGNSRSVGGGVDNPIHRAVILIIAPPGATVQNVIIREPPTEPREHFAPALQCRGLGWVDTDWHFGTSEGGQPEGGPSQGGGVEGGVIINIGGQGGSFFLENDRTHSRIQLDYGALGIGFGEGLQINIAGSTRDMPSRGIGFIQANNRCVLHESDFQGFFEMRVFEITGGGGTSWVNVYLGISAWDMFAPTPVPAFNFAKARGVILATSVGFQFGYGAMFYYGYLSRVS